MMTSWNETMDTLTPRAGPLGTMQKAKQSLKMCKCFIITCCSHANDPSAVTVNKTLVTQGV